MKVLKPIYKERLKSDEVVQALIASAMDKKIQSVARWITIDWPMLTTITAIDIMKREWGLSETDELTQEKEMQHV